MVGEGKIKRKIDDDSTNDSTVLVKRADVEETKFKLNTEQINIAGPILASSDGFLFWNNSNFNME